MEPGVDRVGVDRLVQRLGQLLEDEALLAGAVRRHPQPAVAAVVVDEEDVALLEAARRCGTKRESGEARRRKTTIAVRRGAT